MRPQCHPLRRPLDRLINQKLAPALKYQRETLILDEADPLIRDELLARVEAALFWADEPLPARKLATISDLADAAQARRLIKRLRDAYDADGSAFQIQELAGGYQILTRPNYHSWLLRLKRLRTDLRLSHAAMETLAIVAYRQPVMRATIEGIRGVQCGDMLTQLMEKGLVRIAGRHDSLGRPVLYGTTKKFLSLFGLNTIDDLPEADQFGAP